MKVLTSLITISQFLLANTQQLEFIRYSDFCRYDNRAFSGVRVMHERTVQVVPRVGKQGELIVLRCDAGEMKYSIRLPMNTPMFDHELSSNTSDTIQFVRKPRYDQLNNLRYVPGTIVGGIYERPANYSEWRPVSPLIADSWTSVFHESAVQNRTAMSLILVRPLLRSPDPLEKSYARTTEWTQHIRPPTN